MDDLVHTRGAEAGGLCDRADARRSRRVADRALELGASRRKRLRSIGNPLKRLFHVFTTLDVTAGSRFSIGRLRHEAGL